MTSWISAVFSASAMRSETRPVFTRISWHGTRPPACAGTSRWHTMPLSAPASVRRICPCWYGGEKSTTRVTVSVAVTLWRAHGAERGQEALGVVTHLALVDRRRLVAEQHLDRVLDRHDVARALVVEVLDHRGERGGLARARRTRHEHAAALLLGELADRVGQPH